MASRAARCTTPCSRAKSSAPPGSGRASLGGFLRLAAPVQFDSPDGKPVTLLFVLLVPESATERHLQILSELAQMFSDRHFREQLAEAADAPAVHNLFLNWQVDAAVDRRPAV